MVSSLSAAGSTTRWRKIRAHVLRRDRWICRICGLPNADSAGHIVPRAHGGGDDMTNLQAEHLMCPDGSGRGNLSKGARLTVVTSDEQPRTSREW